MHSCLAYLPPFTSFRRTGGSLAVPIPPRQHSPVSSPQYTTTTVLPHLAPLRCRTHTDRVIAYRLNIIIVSFPHFAQLSARTSRGSYPFVQPSFLAVSSLAGLVLHVCVRWQNIPTSSLLSPPFFMPARVAQWQNTPFSLSRDCFEPRHLCMLLPSSPSPPCPSSPTQTSYLESSFH